MADDIVNLTKEQIEEEKKKAADEATDELKKQLEDKDKEIDSLKNKDTNFKNVRDQLEKAEKERDELKTQIAGATDKVKMDLAKEGLLKVLAGDDQELRKNIEARFEKLGKDAKTPEEVEAALKDAYTLATGGRQAADVIRSNQSGAGGRRAVVKGSGTVDPDVKAFAAEFNKHGANITDDDLKKRA